MTSIRFGIIFINEFIWPKRISILSVICSSTRFAVMSRLNVTSHATYFANDCDCEKRAEIFFIGDQNHGIGEQGTKNEMSLLPTAAVAAAMAVAGGIVCVYSSMSFAH